MTMRHPTLRRAALLAGVLSLAACESDLVYPGEVPFEATLAPVGGSGMSGAVSAISQGRNTTEIAIGVSGGQSATRYAWRIHNGTCAALGAVVGGMGSYPDFLTSNVGDGSVVGAFLNVLLLRDTPYAAAVYGGANRDQVVACGPLEEFAV
jgi:hypothetical protein